MEMRSAESEANYRALKLVQNPAKTVDELTNNLETAAELLKCFATDSRASWDTLNNYGAVLSDQGQFSAAFDYLSRSIDLDPTKRAPRFNLGVVCMALGRRDEGNAHFTRAKELDEADGTLRAYFDPHAH